MRGLKDLNLAFVANATAEECAAFREKLKSFHPYIADSEAVLFRAFGLQARSFKQFVNPVTMVRGLGATLRYGIGQPVGDPMLLGGTFVIDTEGRVVSAHPARDVSDNLSARRIREILGSVKNEIEP